MSANDATINSTLAAGVLPDPVIRDVRADATLVFLKLRPDLDRSGVVTWLKGLTVLTGQLTAAHGAGPVATVACGFGPSFFTTGQGPRFELPADRVPAGFASVPVVATTTQLADADVALYVMSLSAGAVARFLQGLSQTRPTIVGVTIARGYQRDDRRELFGFLDGLRNTGPADRAQIVFVDRDAAPDEPPWMQDATYMAYLQVRQDIERFAALPLEEQQKIFGRRRDDGSRLDLAAGTATAAEAEFTGDGTPAGSHVRKAGPRGDHDAIAIFRRGVPYLDLAPDGSIVGGLQFVSFQNSLDNFETIFDRWIMNPGFPAAGVGVDTLFAGSFATLERAAFFVVPPSGGEFIGEPIFSAPKPPPMEFGRLIIRKKVVDAAGAPALVELGGIGFQLFRQTDNSPVGAAFVTLSNGHAMSPDLPIGVPLVLREVVPPANTDPAPDTIVTLTKRRETLVLTNRRRQPGPYGG